MAAAPFPCRDCSRRARLAVSRPRDRSRTQRRPRLTDRLSRRRYNPLRRSPRRSGGRREHRPQHRGARPGHGARTSSPPSPRRSPSGSAASAWQGEMMEWAMADERLKVEMLRFVDVFPTLRRPPRGRTATSRSTSRARAWPRRRALRWGINLTGPALAASAAGQRRRAAPDEGLRAALHRGPGRARRHPGAQGAARPRHRLHPGRARRGHHRAKPRREAYQRIYLDLLDGLAAEAAAWPAESRVDESAWGPLPRVNLSLKITSLYSQFDPLDFDRQPRRRQGPAAAHLAQGHRDRRRPQARPGAVPLQGPHARTSSRSLLDEDEFRDCRDVGIVLQAYLRDTERDLEPPARLGARPRHAVHRAPGQGGLLGLRDVIAAPAAAGRCRSSRSKWRDRRHATSS